MVVDLESSTPNEEETLRPNDISIAEESSSEDEDGTARSPTKKVESFLQRYTQAMLDEESVNPQELEGYDSMPEADEVHRSRDERFLAKNLMPPTKVRRRSRDGLGKRKSVGQQPMKIRWAVSPESGGKEYTFKVQKRHRYTEKRILYETSDTVRRLEALDVLGGV
ncbi:hypothetical protein J8273_0785 [Carpediemonas membranifera]|uniref:Uncharacterized protein n=1 Tax=Carpediemonas membranifera TaxID=201153 RepID=A0A8J6B259_9EUKA|nr:hypothetical protein J8273_0785 [Carpediemonas membranifera]|eukprot:KAG9397655.1 hypothetical protein J8273_0785 [Carpediemonas membranifera]